VYYSNATVITNFVRTLVPYCRFENNFSAYFRIEINEQNFHIVHRKLINYTLQFPTKAVLYIITPILTWGVRIQNNNIAPATS
jgi:hypothetical protein